MLKHMRTSIDISDRLLARAKRLAQRRRTTLKALVEQGLEKILKEEPRSRTFRLDDASFEGDGLADGLSDTDWEKIRDLAYEGRGS